MFCLESDITIGQTWDQPSAFPSLHNAAFPLADMTSDQEILQMIGTDRDSNMFVDSFSASLEEAGDEGIFSQVQAKFRTLSLMEDGRTGIEPKWFCVGVFLFVSLVTRTFEEAGVMHLLSFILSCAPKDILSSSFMAVR
jgi:hypothetical protein